MFTAALQQLGSRELLDRAVRQRAPLGRNAPGAAKSLSHVNPLEVR